MGIPTRDALQVYALQQIMSMSVMIAHYTIDITGDCYLLLVYMYSIYCTYNSSYYICYVMNLGAKQSQ